MKSLNTLVTEIAKFGGPKRGSGSYAAAAKKSEAVRQRNLKKAAAMVKNGFDHEAAARNHDVSVKELKRHLGINEVAQPRSPDEQRFVDQHTIEFWPHPVAFDHQFDGTVPKDTSRDADYQPGEDEEVYDQAYATEETKMRRNPRKRSPEKIAQIKKDDIETAKAIMRDRIKRGIEEEVYDQAYQTEGWKDSYRRRVQAATTNKTKDDDSAKPEKKLGYKERYRKAIKLGIDIKDVKESSKDGNATELGENSYNKALHLQELPKGTLASYKDKATKKSKANRTYGGIVRASKKLTKESVEATNEAVEVSHDRYLRSHGKKAKGTGGWMFTSKRMGDFDHNDEKQVYSHPGSASFSDAAKGAKAWAKKHGHSAAYVAEHSEVHGFNLQELAKKVLGETFTAGGMSFRDGTKVVVKEADANLLNSLFKSLDAQRQKEMKEHISESLANYKAVLEFALIAKGR